MKAAVAEGKGKVKLRDVAQPEPSPYQSLCKIHACATCTGTDRKIVDEKLFPGMKYPGILGHESFGTVVRCGEKVRHIKEGDLFLRPTAVYNGEMLGDYHSLWGGFAEYGLVTDVQALLEDEKTPEIPGYCQYQQKVPAELSITPPQATMLITLKEIAGYIKNIKIEHGSSVLILGSGAVAMAMCFFAKLKGAFPVIVMGRRDEALSCCRDAGADFVVNNTKQDAGTRVKDMTGGRGVNFVLDAAGDTTLLAASARHLASHGKMATYATRGSGSLELNNFPGPGQWTFEFAPPDEVGSHQYLLDLARLKAINLDLFYSHRMPFADFEKGFELLRNKQAYKIVFEM